MGSSGCFLGSPGGTGIYSIFFKYLVSAGHIPCTRNCVKQSRGLLNKSCLLSSCLGSKAESANSVPGRLCTAQGLRMVFNFFF